MNQLLHDYNNDWWDSIVTLSGSTLIKEYHPKLSLQDLQIYHFLHATLSQLTLTVNLTESYIIDWEHFNSICIQTLALDPYTIYECYNIVDQEQRFATNPSFIPGLSLSDYREKYSCTEFCKYICNIASQQIKYYLNKHSTIPVQLDDMYMLLTPNNIKFSVINGTMHLYITDIAASIHNFIGHVRKQNPIFCCQTTLQTYRHDIAYLVRTSTISANQFISHTQCTLLSNLNSQTSLSTKF